LHPAWTYMLRDIGGSLWGVVVFTLALAAPGYCAGQWLNVCGFRLRGLREQAAWSLALSFGLGTAPLVAVAWLGGLVAGEVVLAGLGVAAVVMLVRNRPRVDLSRCELWVAAGWLIVVIGSLVDVGIGTRLWMSVTSYDHGLRTAFVDAVMRTGVPSVDPLYWPGHDVTLRYYYFWYVTCGVVARLAHISARQALIASCVWPMFGVVAMLALIERHLLGWSGAVLRRRWWISVGLLSVTGLDIFVAVFNGLTSNFQGDMEWWSIDHVASWMDTFLWVPHHAASLICCLLGMLLVWIACKQNSPGERITLAVVAGISFASAFGLSTYVAVATAIVLTVWACWELVFEGKMRVLWCVGLSGLVSGVALLPYLAQLLRRGEGSGKGTTRVLGFGIRQMMDPGLLQGISSLERLRDHHPFAAGQVVAGVLLVPGYVIELGFFAAVLVLMQLRKGDKSDGEKTLLLWTWIGLLAATFVRSRVIATNDFGLRAILLPQFLLLSLAVGVLERSSGWLRRSLLGLAAIGVCGTVYQGVMLRTFLPWQETHGNVLMADLAERNYALRSAYAELPGKIPASARMQYNPASGGYFLSAQMLALNHQVITEEEPCNVSFGGEASACPAIQSGVATLFASGGSISEAAKACHELGIEYLVATRWDKVWQVPEGWVWRLPVVVGEPSVRVVACRAPFR